MKAFVSIRKSRRKSFQKSILIRAQNDERQGRTEMWINNSA